MGWQDRDYASEEGYSRATGRRHPGIPSHWKVSTILLVINVGLFLIAPPMSRLFQQLVMRADEILNGQIWRLLTACFLHWDTSHLFFNMIGLYCFGAALEHGWGKKRFLLVYLVAGVLANVVYVLLYLFGWSGAAGVAAGASGCIYAILGACAILMPHLRVLVFFVIPMNIRTFLAIFVVWGIINVSSGGPNAGGDAVHLAGLVVGLGYAYWRRRIPSTVGGIRTVAARVVKTERPQGAWRHKMEQEERGNAEVDQILAKIKEQGIGSLTNHEKKALARASEQQQAEDEKLGRIDKL